jgi:hypothetical protein
LAGSHQWHNFQDNGHRLPEGKDPPQVFDYDAYLDSSACGAGKRRNGKMNSPRAW